MKRFLLSIWEIVEVILIALVTVFFIRSFVVQPFLVSGASMEPSFQNGDYLLIDEVTYRFRDPKRGEAIVFRYPGDETSFFIKRIIGLPGETVNIRNGAIVISQSDADSATITLTEAYLSSTTKTTGDKTIKLAPDQYFVMGDNRSNSFDSRNWGPLNRKEIIGLVRLRIFPFNEFQSFSTPIYQ